MKRILIFAFIVALPSLLAAGWLAVEPVAAWEVSSIVSLSQRKPALDHQSRDVSSPLPQLLDEVHWRREGADCQPSYTHYASDSVMKFVRNVDSLAEFQNTETWVENPFNWEPNEWTNRWDPSTREVVWTSGGESPWPPDYLPTSVTPSAGASVTLEGTRYRIHGRAAWCMGMGRHPEDRYGWLLTNEEAIVMEWEGGVHGDVSPGNLWVLYDEELGVEVHRYWRMSIWDGGGNLLVDKLESMYLTYPDLQCARALFTLSEQSCDFTKPIPGPTVEPGPSPTPPPPSPTPQPMSPTPGPMSPTPEPTTPTPGPTTPPPEPTSPPPQPTTPVPQPTTPPRPPSAPDLMVRDNPSDDGRGPSSAPFWISPDIVLRNEKDGILAHQDPIFGQTNYIYVRVHNIGATQSKPFSVGFYWGSGAAALFWPQSWHYIGSIAVGSGQVGVPAGGQVWAGPLPWDPPAPGHYCLLARIDSIEDPVVHEGAVSLDNNLAQLNLNIVEKPEEGDETEIDIVGPDGGLEDFVVVIIRFPQLPAGAHLTAYIDPSTVSRWLQAAVEIEGAYLEANALVPWEETREIRLAGLPLEPLEEVPFIFQVTGPPGSHFTIDVEEWVNDVLVGGNSFMTRAYYEQHVLPPEPPLASPGFQGCIPWPMLGTATLLVLAYAGSRRR